MVVAKTIATRATLVIILTGVLITVLITGLDPQAQVTVEWCPEQENLLHLGYT